MPTLRGRPEFMRYLPDTCFKKEPPAEFFWKIYSVLAKNDFDVAYSLHLNRVMEMLRKPQTLKITHETKQPMEARKDESLRLLMELWKPGVNDNVTYLRKGETRKRPVVPQQAPSRNLFQTPARQDTGPHPPGSGR